MSLSFLLPVLMCGSASLLGKNGDGITIQLFPSLSVFCLFVAVVRAFSCFACALVSQNVLSEKCDEQEMVSCSLKLHRFGRVLLSST